MIERQPEEQSSIKQQLIRKQFEEQPSIKQPLIEKQSDEQPSNEQELIEQQPVTTHSTNRMICIRTELTNEEKKKIHNQSCTRKQRARCYRHEVIRRNIDNRFSYTDMKDILKRLQWRARVVFWGVAINSGSVKQISSEYEKCNLILVYYLFLF